MGERIKEAMESRGVTQAELAEAVGVTQAFMSYVIHGIKKPSVDVLGRIAKRLDVTMDSLAG